MSDTVTEFAVKTLAIHYRLAEAQLETKELLADIDPEAAKLINTYITFAQEKLSAVMKQINDAAAHHEQQTTKGDADGPH